MSLDLRVRGSSPTVREGVAIQVKRPPSRSGYGPFSKKSEKSTNQIEDQTEGQGDNQHGNDWNVDLNTLAFIVNVAWQLSKPIESARVDQEAHDYQAGAPKNHP